MAMGYTVVDLLDKFISIEQSGYELYTKVANEADVPEKVRTIAKVFAIEENRHIELYKDLKERVKDDPDISIDFSIYDRASKMISDFAKFTRNFSAKDTNELIDFFLNFEEENLALLIIIQGILVQSKEDEKTTRYKVLAELIKEEQKHIDEVSVFKR
jgi:rubrerythrin